MAEQDHKPTAELIKRASVIADPQERRQVIGEIKELRRRYAGTDAEFKAPNGQPSIFITALGDELGRQAWYAVRTPSFKNWFGDWERAARIAVFENSEDIPLDGNAYQGKYELNKESILDYLKNTFHEKNMRNPAINADILLAGKGIKKLTSWGMNNETYKKLFAHIPEMTEKAIFLAEEESNKINSHYKKYNHLACGIEIDNIPHTVHIILGENHGQWYYTHIVLDIEKGSLLAGIQHPNPGHPIHASPSNIKDTTLLRLLQADSSKIIDENGEPLPVCLGDKSKRDMSTEPQGISFAGGKTVAADYLFLNIKSPLVLNENSFNYYDIDYLNPFIQTLGYDGVVRPYGNEFFVFDPSQIKSVTGTTKFYLHEVETQEKLRGVSIQAGIESGTPLGASKLIIGKKLNEVNKNISEIVDKYREALMQIPITSQAEYDNAVKTRQHMKNELVIQDSPDFIVVRTDVTVGKNGRCKTEEKSAVNIIVRENGILTAEGKTTVNGFDNANIIAKGNCKITLNDSAFGNCYEHCQILLNGKSKISADGNCTIHAYDESSVSASGSSKVYTHQKAVAKGTDVTALLGDGEATLYGQKNCTITAKDNCIVYASDACTVQAADNCLVVANKYATIKAKDNCLIMSNENPNDNITFSDKCEHLKLEDVNDKNIMSALKQIAQTKAAIERPYITIQILKDNLPQTKREAVNRRLNTMGLKDQIATKNYLYSLIETAPARKNQTLAQNLERQLETARKAGYVQGVCECVAVVGNEQNMGKKLLSEMQVTKDMAKKFANPETYKTLEKGIFAQKPEQKLEQTHSRKL